MKSSSSTGNISPVVAVLEANDAAGGVESLGMKGSEKEISMALVTESGEELKKTEVVEGAIRSLDNAIGTLKRGWLMDITEADEVYRVMKEQTDAAREKEHDDNHKESEAEAGKKMAKKK